MPTEKLSTVKDITGYATSRDYVKLVELMKKNRVSCVSDSNYGNTKNRLSAEAILYPYDGIYTVQSDSLIIIHENREQEFISQCQRLNVEFIVPNEEISHEKV